MANRKYIIASLFSLSYMFDASKYIKYSVKATFKVILQYYEFIDYRSILNKMCIKEHCGFF